MNMRKSTGVALFLAGSLVSSSWGQTVTISTSGTYDVVASEAEATARELPKALVVTSAAHVVVAASDVTVRLYPALQVPRLTVNAGCANVKACLSDETDVVAEGAVSVETFLPDWNPVKHGWAAIGLEPELWVDPSAEGAIEYVKKNDVEQETEPGGDKFMYALYDRRHIGGTDGRYVKNGRFKNNASDLLTTVFPIVRAQKQNGLPLIDCGAVNSGRRTYLYRGNNTQNAQAWLYPQTAFAIYNAEKGGGKAIFAGGEFGRVAGIGNSMTTNRYSAWKNGQPVWTDEAKFDNGSQLLTLAADGKMIDGFGYSSRQESSTGHPLGTDCGGMCYGEMLFFNESLPDVQRVMIERYMARKWGVTYAEPEVRLYVRAYGAGSLSAKGPLCIGGAFKGTLTLDGALEVDGATLPPGDEVVPTENCLAWFDPDKEGALTLSSGGDRIESVYSRIGWDADGTVRLWYGGSGYGGRKANLLQKAEGFGVRRNWMMFSGENAMRVSTLPSTGSAQTTLNPHTILWAQNSVRGGGSPLLTFTNPTSGRLLPRILNGEPGDPDVPIWRDTTTQRFYRNGQTRLNGCPVDGTKIGFLGRPEVVTAVCSDESNLDTVNFGCIGFYNGNSETKGENVGELLAYAGSLTDEQLQQVEAYLMWKWFGETRKGYSALANATVGGTGAVKALSHETMPKLAAGFSGSVDLGAQTLNFTFANAAMTADNAILAGANAVTLPAEVTVNVAFAGKPKSGAHVLLTGDLQSEVTWTLGAVTGMRDRAQASLRYDTAAKTLWLDVRNPGLILIVK